MALFIPEHNVYATDVHGVRRKIAIKGVPIPMNEAKRLGLVGENKLAPAPAENKLETPAPNKTDDKPAEPDSDQPSENSAVIDATDSAEVDATDSAIRLAQEYGIDLSQVTGTGADGRIIRSDVLTLVGG